jgi:hypothetical protein
MYVPFRHERVLRKTTMTMGVVVFVNIPMKTVDLFVAHGAGELIEGVPFADLAPMDQRRIFQVA